MKKTYIAPLTEEVNVEETEMICTSIENEGTTSNNGITSGDSRLIDDNLFFDEE